MNKNDKNSPLISIIVPVYNVEKYIGKCIESILQQDYKNIELLLIDDGSSDHSPQICDEYSNKDSRVAVFHKKNQGVSSARNFGLSNANGEYIAFVDGDDFVMNDYITYLYNLIKKYGADISLSKEMFGNFNEKQISKDIEELWSSEDAIESILCYQVPIGCYSKLFKKDVLNSVKFNNELFIGEGFNFNIDSFKNANKVVAGKRKIYYYRRDNATSAMTVFSPNKCKCGIYALKVIKENLNINSLRIKNAWEFANWRTHSDFYDMIVLANAQKDNLDLYNQCRYVTKKYFLYSLKVPANRKNKIRAIVMGTVPDLIPFAMKLRKLKYKVKV